MLAEERFNEIMKLLEKHRTITVQELTEALHTSESTIRRDLMVLHNRGKLIKVHGGATALNMEYSTKDATVAIRQDLNMEEKRAIGSYAASLIKKNDFVYIDAGTTTDILIDKITEQDAVYVTNGILQARKLIQKGCRVFLPGGELKESTLALVGAEAIASLGKYNFTKGFFGTNGIQKESGFTTPDIHEAAVKGTAVRQCKERYILADPCKFNQISSVTFADFEDATIITTSLQDAFFAGHKNILEVSKL